jgi:hypothetical protein
MICYRSDFVPETSNAVDPPVGFAPITWYISPLFNVTVMEHLQVWQVL